MPDSAVLTFTYNDQPITFRVREAEMRTSPSTGKQL
jgi:hypothetical protein